MRNTSGGYPCPAWDMESITDNIEALGGLQLGVSPSTHPTAQPDARQQVPQVRSSSGQRGSSTGRLRAGFALVSKCPGPAAGPGGASSSEAAWAACRTWRQAAMRFISVAQVERFAKVVRDGRPVDLVTEYSKEPPDVLSRSVHAMLDQPWTHMVVTGVEFSWLSCYYYTWIAWRSHDDPTRLRLSQPFRHDTDGNGGITVLAALAWLQDQALSRLDLSIIAWRRSWRPHLSTGMTGQIPMTRTNRILRMLARCCLAKATLCAIQRRARESGKCVNVHRSLCLLSLHRCGTSRHLGPTKTYPPSGPPPSTHAQHWSSTSVHQKTLPPCGLPHRHGTDPPPRSNKKHGQVQQDADPGDTGMPPQSNKVQSHASVSVPLLAANMFGPLGDLIGEGSSCFVRLAKYHGQEAAVKMLMCSHQPYEVALTEATMYQVGTRPFHPPHCPHLTLPWPLPPLGLPRSLTDPIPHCTPPAPHPF